MTDFQSYSVGVHPIIKLEDDWNNLLDHGICKAPDAVVYLESGTVKAVNGATGKILSSNADLSIVVQACFDAGCKWVYIKSGDYPVWATTVTMAGGLRLTGAWMDATNITGTAVVADAMIKFTGTSSKVEMLTLNCDGKFDYGVRIQGSTCECGWVQVLSAAHIGFALDSAVAVTGSKLSYCKAKECGMIGIDVVNNNTDVWIDTCTVSVSGYDIDGSIGIRVNATGVQIKAPHLWGLDYGMVIANVSSIENLTMTDAYIESNVRHNIHIGQHSMRACKLEGVFWTNVDCNTARTTRAPLTRTENDGTPGVAEIFCDIFTETPNPNPSSYRHERNTIAFTFNGNSKQDYAIYRNTYYFRYNNLSGCKFRTTYNTAILGEKTADSASWNIFNDPDVDFNIGTTQTTGYWSDPIMKTMIGRHDGKIAVTYNSELDEARIMVYLDETADWWHAQLMDIPTAATQVPIGGIIIWTGKKSDIPDGWALCDGDEASKTITCTAGTFTIFVRNLGAGATCANGTGTCTGSPVALVEGINTITVTAPGTFVITLSVGGTALIKSGTGTVTSSPVRTFRTPTFTSNYLKSVTAGEAGGTGGSTTVTHSPTTGAVQAGAGTTVVTAIANHTNVEPPYYTVCYIMRIR